MVFVTCEFVREEGTEGAKRMVVQTSEQPHNKSIFTLLPPVSPLKIHKADDG